MRMSEAGLDLIRNSEGLRLTAYPDPASGGDPWTIGYGHTGGIRLGDSITEDQANDYLRQDVSKFESGVASLAPVTTQGQFDALVDFAYNLGLGNLKTSTLLLKHNSRNYTGAALEFSRWNKAGGKVMAGLTKRRAAEAELYQS